MMVDGRTMKLINILDKEGFLRLSPTGDNRHLAVADGSSYQLLDAGTWEQPHGDHAHIYTTEPTLSPLNLNADHTGHVINHADKLPSSQTAPENFRYLIPLNSPEKTSSLSKM